MSTFTRHTNIAALPGLRRETCDHLLQMGITTIEQLMAFEPEDLKQFKGIKTSAYRIHASARAFVEQQPVWYNPMPETCFQCGIHFDLETNPATGVPWSLGWSNGEDSVQIALVAPGHESQLQLADGTVITFVSNSDEAWRVFADCVDAEDSPIYHWSGFDAGVLRATGPLDVRRRLESRMYDLLAAFNHSVRLPIPNSSLKTVAGYLQFAWAAYEDWWQAYQDYQHWLRGGDVETLAQACSYQRDDVQALALVWQWMNEQHR
jgi:predicted RecB family nuclease